MAATPKRKIARGGHAGLASLRGALLGAAVAVLIMSSIRHSEVDLSGEGGLHSLASALPFHHTGGGGGGAGAHPAMQRRPLPVKNATTLMVTFGNISFKWVASVLDLGVPFLVGALDDEVVKLCVECGIPHESFASGETSFFRQDFKKFRGMGARKVGLVRSLLEDWGVGTVVISDLDTVWLRNPAPYLEQFAAADWFISTDCLSAEAERRGWAVPMTPETEVPRCGHLPGSRSGRAFNTGVFAVRNRPASLAVLGKWQGILLDPSNEYKGSGGLKFKVTDQLALNMVLEEKWDGAEQVAGAPRCIWAAARTLKVHPLPVPLFAGGHQAFVQRLPWRHGTQPYVVHATFQPFHGDLHRQGKRARFREVGLWYLDTEDYYQGRFLAYDNSVLDVVARAEQDQYGGSMAPLAKHFLGVSYQLAIFRDALVAAKVLNRTLVLPQHWCWCDMDHHPHLVEKCRMRGTDMELPYRCPADAVLHLPYLEEGGVQYRMPGFLDLPWVRPEIRHSQSPIDVLPQRPADPAATTPAALEGLAGVAWPGISERELRAATAPVDRAAVLSIRGMVPDLMAGLDSAAEAAAFEQTMRTAMRDNYWCCSGIRTPLPRASVRYELPRPLTSAWAAWSPPRFPVPDYCDQIEGENLEFLAYVNHPCNFMFNQTAAKMASQIH